MLGITRFGLKLIYLYFQGEVLGITRFGLKLIYLYFQGEVLGITRFGLKLIYLYFQGEVLGITRFGLAKMKESVLMLASVSRVGKQGLTLKLSRPSDPPLDLSVTKAIILLISSEVLMIRALIFGMHDDLCDEPIRLPPCPDIDLDR